VWIDYFNGRDTRTVQALERLSESLLLVGDLIMAEVLQGFRIEADFRRAEEFFARFEFGTMVGREVAIAAARNHRSLRRRGVTPRNTIDTIIATFCVMYEHHLLHNDRDFEFFERHVGLRVLSV
jgi:hypothetical protein